MTIFYPDVSSFQTGISFAGCVIAMTKATENDNYTNPDYAPAKAGAANAALFAVAILAAKRPELAERLIAWRKAKADKLLKESVV